MEVYLDFPLSAVYFFYVIDPLYAVVEHFSRMLEKVAGDDSRIKVLSHCIFRATVAVLNSDICHRHEKLQLRVGIGEFLW